MLKIDNIPLNKSEVFELYESAKLIGTFQTESNLCRHHSKLLAPKSIREVSNLIAGVRPGVLECRDDEGITMMERYRLNVNKLAAPKFIHPCMEPFLKDTFGVMLYQEQLTSITEYITNFDPVERHRLLKAVSKKSQEEIYAVQELFIKSAVEKGIVTADAANKIYESFKASGRYLFNLAHSVGYAIVSYLTAYLKRFYGIEFFCSWMQCSPKTDLRLLINDARGFGFKIIPPSINDIKSEFHIVDNNTIRFGFSGIQGCGAAQLEKIQQSVEKIEKYTHKKISELSWLEFLVYGFYIVGKMFDIQIDKSVKESDYKTLSKSVIENLIKCGALDCFKVPRNRMLHELRQYKSLSPGEKKTLTDNIGKFKSLLDAIIWLRDGEKARLDKLRDKDPEKGSAVEKRYMTLRSLASLLEKPPVRVTDSADDIVIYERELLNVAISASKLDKYYSDQADTTIKEYLDGKNKGVVCIKCEISRLSPHVCKTGDEMAFISIIDDTGENDDCVMFTKEFADMKQKDLDYEGAQVLLWGERDWKKGSLIIKRVESLV